MAQQFINLGTNPSDGSGDGLRTALGKVNDNFAEVYEGLAGKVDASAIDAEASARATAVTNEANARAAADTTLQGHIDAKAPRLRMVMLPGGSTQVTVDDLDATIFTDAYSDGPAQINLPLFADAFAHGGAVRVVAGRDWVDGQTFVSVYPQSSEWSPNRFLVGSQVLFSLYSTGKGDSLELVPVVINGVNYWQVTQFGGLWQDRD